MMLRLPSGDATQVDPWWMMGIQVNHQRFPLVISHSYGSHGPVIDDLPNLKVVISMVFFYVYQRVPKIPCLIGEFVEIYTILLHDFIRDYDTS